MIGISKCTTYFFEVLKSKKSIEPSNKKYNNNSQFIRFSTKEHRAWWIKISTSQPKCIYYFGSFTNRREAKENCWGYIEDLTTEKTFGITVEIIYCLQPENLTIYDDDL